MTWLFQHGWGFDQTLWKPWKKAIPSEKLIFLDRGYFGNDLKYNHLTYPDIVICHSFGLHLVPRDVIDNCQFLIILSGFISFDSNLEQMRSELIKRNLATLKRFYRWVFYPDRFVGSFSNRLICWDKLLYDLNYLIQSKLVPIKNKPVLILHGSDDCVVSIEKGKELHHAHQGSELVILPNLGHSIPYSDLCIRTVLRWVCNRDNY